MNEVEDITWHYVMDIHEPEEVWYSLDTQVRCGDVLVWR
jgi:hypothetical protein